uniref:FAS1 domain-containing protein n=1 Tax=Chenopodium quinoa TaxID=63459 RepID=A0A803KT49_CHEQI
MASHSLSLSSASHSPWLGPVTVFAPADASVRTCTSCSLTLLLQEHTVPGLYPLDYLNQLIFGTKIESILPGRCLTVTSAANSTKIFIGGAEITHPNLFISDHVIIHGLQGFISHFSPYSCSMDRMTSLSLRHLSPSVALTRMMLVDAGIRLRLSGYSFLALAMRVKYAELVTLQNMTIFAVDDSTIFQGGHSYVHGVRFHIIPNQMLKLADLESLPPSTVLPTFESGETLTITTPGGGGSSSPLRINYVKIKYPDLIYNYKLVVHGIGSPFPHLRQSIPVSTGRSGFYPITAGEYGSDVRESSFGNDQLVFYVTPTEALEKFNLNPSKNKFRLGGLVLEGSVHQPPSSPEMEFVITDLMTDIVVRYQGSLPDLFREGHSVVVEGFVKPFTDEIKESGMSGKTKEISAKARSGECYFSATEVLAKHDEKYMPGEVAAAIEKNKKKLDEEAEAQKTAAA